MVPWQLNDDCDCNNGEAPIPDPDKDELRGIGHKDEVHFAHRWCVGAVNNPEKAFEDIDESNIWP